MCHAVQLGNQNMVSSLAKNFNANIHVLDGEKRNLLHIAAMSSSGRELIPYLHGELGLDPRIADMNGRTPLHYVACSDKVDAEFKVHEYLVRISNCPVNYTDKVC
jgi:hypothetical protein